MICWKLSGFLSVNLRAFYAKAIFTRCFGEGGHRGQGRIGEIETRSCSALDAEPCTVATSSPPELRIKCGGYSDLAKTLSI